MNKENVNKRWAEYFEKLLKIVDDGVANIKAVGNGIIPACHRGNVEIEYDEVNGAVRRLKGDKSLGIDEIAV